MLLASALVLAVIGPFGTFDDMSLAVRLIYWAGCVFGGGVIYSGVLVIGMGLIRRRGWPWRPVAAAVTLIASVGITGLVAVAEVAARGDRVGWTPSPPALFPYVLLITVLISAGPWWWSLRREGLIGGGADAASPKAGESGAPIPPPPIPLPMDEGIPPELAGPLLALTMEDHYVRVHTAEGSTLVLMRMRDAVAALAGRGGLRVHRSHWVAAEAVRGWRRDATGRVRLTLSNGAEVPVSRSRLGLVRDAGWMT